MAPILEVDDLKAFYGRTQALHGVSFSMEPGGITTILGANGAGKTTTLRSISAMVRTVGSIRFNGEPRVELIGREAPYVGERRPPLKALAQDARQRLEEVEADDQRAGLEQISS